MKRALCAGILAASAFAGWAYWSAHRNLYSLNVYIGHGPIYVSGPSCHIGTSPNWIGFGEYTDIGSPSEWGTKRDTPTFTVIDLASHQYKIKVPVWQVGSVASFFLGFLACVCWLAVTARGGFNGAKGLRDEH
jgi:hypothetical protein